jgi:protein gp37
MADKSKIQWTDYTLNFLTGCSKVSAGCDNRYAIRDAWMQERRFQSEKYKGLTVLNQPEQTTPNLPQNNCGTGSPLKKEGNTLDWTGEVRVHPELIGKPLHLKKPRKIFVNSMSDLFHEKILTDMHLKVAVTWFFDVMLRAKQHQYQILTKRAHIMRDFVKEFLDLYEMTELPKHIWLGVSVENQKVADVRISKLLEIPGATKWLSCEPLLSPLDFSVTNDELQMTSYLEKLDWVVVGGESGAGARIMWASWAEKIIEDCKENNVPVFMKQMGSVLAKANGYKDKKGGDMEEWQRHFRVREFPTIINN